MITTVDDIALIPGLLDRPLRVLLLGGTGEAAALAELLHAAGHDVTTSLAGRTREPRPLAGKMRTGGFGGADGLAGHLAASGTEVLIDVTHPFATRMSANARHAVAISNTRLIVFERPRWAKCDRDQWIEVASLEQACAALPDGARVLLALGSQHIAPFAARSSIHFVIRMVDLPSERLPFTDFTLVTSRPGDVASETQLLENHRISHIVCRNSGGSAAYAKIEAARNLSLPVVMITR
jgi:precorrin-6A/cobalt-precorrin-6A reductase